MIEIPTCTLPAPWQSGGHASVTALPQCRRVRNAERPGHSLLIFIFANLDRTQARPHPPGTRGDPMLRHSVSLLMVFLTVTPALAVQPFPSSFRTQEIKTNGTTLHVRVGGQGPAVVMLHGFGDTGDMWAPAAKALMRNHTVVVPDLRGMGLSEHPAEGYTKKNQAVDIVGVLDALNI